MKEKKFALKICDNMFRKSYEVSKYSIFTSKLICEDIWKIKKKLRLKFGKKLRRFICRKCNSILIPGRTLLVRFLKNRKVIEYVCMSCGFVRRFQYSKK